MNMFIVATNVIASRLPEHQATGTLHAYAKSLNPFFSYKGLQKRAFLAIFLDTP